MEGSRSSAGRRGHLEVGSTVSGKWKVGLRIGKGTFSEVYVANNRVTKEVVAVKVDKPPPKHGAQTESQLDPEYKVLKALQAYPFFPRLLDFCQAQFRGGSSSASSSSSGDGNNALVMQLLGESLTQLRLRQPSGRFRPSVALDLSMQMLHAIEACHRAGFVHRDVKPSNFCVGGPTVTHSAIPVLRERAGIQRYTRSSLPPSLADLNMAGMRELRGQVFLLDYGLARPYLISSKVEQALAEGADSSALGAFYRSGGEAEHREQRRTNLFRGTQSYASVSAHELRDLGRRDDLWSLFYTIVDLATPDGLPWRDVNREQEWAAKRLSAAEEHNAAAMQEVAREEAEAKERDQREGAADAQTQAATASGGIGAAVHDETTPTTPALAQKSSSSSSAAAAAASTTTADAASAASAPVGSAAEHVDVPGVAEAQTPGTKRKEVHKMKQDAMENPGMLVREGLPGREHFLRLSNHLAQLKHHSMPDYSLIADCIARAREELAAAEEEEENRLWQEWLRACSSSPTPSHTASAASEVPSSEPVSRGQVRSFPGGEGDDGCLKPQSHRTPPAALGSATLAVAPAVDCESGLFDMRGIALSCDGVLFSRGGKWDGVPGAGMSFATVGSSGRSRWLSDIVRDDDEDTSERGAAGMVEMPAPGTAWSREDIETALYRSLGAAGAAAVVGDQDAAPDEDDVEEGGRELGRKRGRPAAAESDASANKVTKLHEQSPTALLAACSASFPKGQASTVSAAGLERAEALIRLTRSLSDASSLEARLLPSRAAHALHRSALRVLQPHAEGMEQIDPGLVQMAVVSVAAAREAIQPAWTAMSSTISASSQAQTAPPQQDSSTTAKMLMQALTTTTDSLATTCRLAEWVAAVEHRLPIGGSAMTLDHAATSSSAASAVAAATAAAASAAGMTVADGGSLKNLTPELALRHLEGLAPRPLLGAPPGALLDAWEARQAAPSFDVTKLLPGTQGGGEEARAVRLAVWSRQLAAAEWEERLRVAPTASMLAKQLSPSLSMPRKHSSSSSKSSRSKSASRAANQAIRSKEKARSTSKDRPQATVPHAPTSSSAANPANVPAWMVNANPAYNQSAQPEPSAPPPPPPPVRPNPSPESRGARFSGIPAARQFPLGVAHGAQPPPPAHPSASALAPQQGHRSQHPPPPPVPPPPPPLPVHSQSVSSHRPANLASSSALSAAAATAVDADSDMSRPFREPPGRSHKREPSPGPAASWPAQPPAMANAQNNHGAGPQRFAQHPPAAFAQQRVVPSASPPTDYRGSGSVPRASAASGVVGEFARYERRHSGPSGHGQPEGAGRGHTHAPPPGAPRYNDGRGGSYERGSSSNSHERWAGSGQARGRGGWESSSSRGGGWSQHGGGRSGSDGRMHDDRGYARGPRAGEYAYNQGGAYGGHAPPMRGGHAPPMRGGHAPPGGRGMRGPPSQGAPRDYRDQNYR